MGLRITPLDALFVLAVILIPIGFAAGVPVVAFAGIACVVPLFAAAAVRVIRRMFAKSEATEQE